MQTTNNILLIRPASFGFNEETRSSNAFQKPLDANAEEIRLRAIAEFNELAATLSRRGVSVFVFDDTKTPTKNDAVFPNNWISFHPDGTVVLYPMLSANRRLERRTDIIDSLRHSFEMTNVIDLTGYEREGIFLEGTGSIVFDHDNKAAFAALSPRTDKTLFLRLCDQLEYRPVTFTARDQHNIEIYHTNVMMCIGERFAVVCLESITDETERVNVVDQLTSTGHEIVDITFEQMVRFAGNMLAIDPNLLAMSQSAFDSLTTGQKSVLESHCELLPFVVPTIETVGGGSVRCMIAEIFLPAARGQGS